MKIENFLMKIIFEQRQPSPITLVVINMSATVKLDIRRPQDFLLSYK